jgi:hypothetical protein
MELERNVDTFGVHVLPPIKDLSDVSVDLSSSSATDAHSYGELYLPATVDGRVVPVQWNIATCNKNRTMIPSPWEETSDLALNQAKDLFPEMSSNQPYAFQVREEMDVQCAGRRRL